MCEKKVGLVPRLRFPDYVGQRLRKALLMDVTAESGDRIGDDLSKMPVMGVTKVEGIVPMEERLISSDITRYKIVKNNWFAYNPMRLNIGSIARWEGEQNILVSPDYVVFKCLKGADLVIDPEYLDHFRQSGAWARFVSESGDGSVRVRIYYRDLARLQLFLPGHAEQQKIADCLSSLDALITAQADKLDTLKTHKQGLMQQIFPREGETVPRLRFPEFREAGDWEETKLGNLCDMRAGKFVPATAIDDNHKESFYPCYGGNGLRGFTKTHTHSGKYPLIGRQGALCGNITLANGKFHATEHAVVATPNEGVNVDWLFFELALLNLNRFATGQAQPGLSVEVLNQVECVTPKKEAEQKKIADFLSSIDALIAAQADKLDALKTHKRGLMQQLFPNPEAVAA